MEEELRKLAHQVKLDTIEACAKIAADAEQDRGTADAPYDSGSGSCGYAKACYDIERTIRALAVSSTQGKCTCGYLHGHADDCPAHPSTQSGGAAK